MFHTASGKSLSVKNIEKTRLISGKVNDWLFGDTEEYIQSQAESILIEYQPSNTSIDFAKPPKDSALQQNDKDFLKSSSKTTSLLVNMGENVDILVPQNTLEPKNDPQNLNQTDFDSQDLTNIRYSKSHHNLNKFSNVTSFNNARQTVEPLCENASISSSAAFSTPKDSLKSISAAAEGIDKENAIHSGANATAKGNVALVGFAKASGKSIFVQQEALKHAGNLFKASSDHKDNHSKEIELTKPTMTSKVISNNALIKENHGSGSLNAVRDMQFLGMDYSNALPDMQLPEIKSSNEFTDMQLSEIKSSNEFPDMQLPEIKSSNAPKMRMSLSKQPFLQTDNSISNNGNSNETLAPVGFTKASGKTLSVSHKALQHAQNAIKSFNDTRSSCLNENSVKEKGAKVAKNPIKTHLPENVTKPTEGLRKSSNLLKNETYLNKQSIAKLDTLGQTSRNSNENRTVNLQTRLDITRSKRKSLPGPETLAKRPGNSRTKNFIPVIPKVAATASVTAQTSDTSQRTKHCPKSVVDLQQFNCKRTKLAEHYGPLPRHKGSDYKAIFSLEAALKSTFAGPSGLEYTSKSATELLIKAGAEKELLSQLWVDNHYAQIVWKTAGMINFDSSLSPTRWTWENVHKQLLYRYEREIVQAQRSCVKLIAEQDDTSARFMVLFCAEIDSKHSRIKLSDGWYSIWAVLDSELAKATAVDKIFTGQKLAILGTELVSPGVNGRPEATAVLDLVSAPTKIMLKLNANRVRRARWDAKLGFYRHFGFQMPSIALRAISPVGGLVSSLRCKILRVYPLQFLEKLLDGSTTMRNQRDEERAQLMFDMRRTETRNVSQEQSFIPSDGSDMTVQSSGSSQQWTPLSAVTDGAELYRRMKTARDASSFAVELSTWQQSALERHIEAKNEHRRAKALDEMPIGPTADVEARNVIPIINLLVGDVDGNRSAIALLSIWRPEEDWTKQLGIGKVLVLYKANIQANSPVSLSQLISRCRELQSLGIPHDLEAASWLQISTSSQSRYYLETSEPAAKREFMRPSDLSPGLLLADFNLIGVIVAYTEPERFGKWSMQSLYLSDESKNVVFVSVKTARDGSLPCGGEHGGAGTQIGSVLCLTNVIGVAYDIRKDVYVAKTFSYSDWGPPKMYAESILTAQSLSLLQLGESWKDIEAKVENLKTGIL